MRRCFRRSEFGVSLVELGCSTHVLLCPGVTSMLFVSVGISLILLSIVIIAGRSAKIPLQTVFLTGLACGLLPIGVGIVFPALVLQAILLVVVAGMCHMAGWQARRFFALSCVASLAAYGIVGWFAFQEVARLIEQFPYVSMEARLPPPR